MVETQLISNEGRVLKPNDGVIEGPHTADEIPLQVTLLF